MPNGDARAGPGERCSSMADHARSNDPVKSVRHDSSAPEAVQLAALALRRAARPTLSDEYGWLAPDHRDRWAVIDKARRRGRCPDARADHGHDLEEPRPRHERPQAVADPHLR